MADDSSNTDVGARYAKALFELADEGGSLAAVEADLKGLRRMQADSPDLRRLVTSPAFPADVKARALLAVVDAAVVQPLTRKFIGLLAANGRVAALPAVISGFERLAAARRGAVAAEVTTAIALTPEQQAGVAAALRQALGKDPELTTRVDPAILGGIRVKVGSRLFDSSLKTRLDSLKFALQRA